MHRIIAGGTGFIGQHLVRHWYNNGADVTVIGRDKNKIQQTFGIDINAMTWDECSKVENLDIIKSADIMVNLCGAGVADKRWSAARKRELLQSRIDSTQKCVDICLACNDEAPALFNASAIGTYGLQTPAAEGLPPGLDEDTEIDFNKADDFLAQIGREWEKTLRPLQDKGQRVVIMRFGVVLSPDGGALQRMLLPFKLGLGLIFGHGRQPFSWIAIDDLIAAIDFLSINPDMSGPVNCVAPHAVTSREFSKTLAKTLHRPCFLRKPAFALKMLFGQMGDECLLRGQHVVPKRLQEAGFTFYHENLDEALKTLLSA